MALAPEARIFVAEQSGYLRIIKGDQLLDRALLSIPGRVDSQGERGWTLESTAHDKLALWIADTSSWRGGPSSSGPSS